MARKRSEEAVAVNWNPGDVILGLYEVREVLGRGGMGSVYRVHHRGWDADLAVKSPHGSVLSHAKGVDLFERECEMWVKLGLHPNIASCYYVRRLGGVPRVFAEYVKGGNLHTWVYAGTLYRKGPRASLRRMLDIAIQMAWGLGYSHDRGLIHQDMKPANVLMTRTGVAKITDFGLAHALELAASSTNRQNANRRGVEGTPVYASPEQTMREPLTIATDIWSWGTTLLEMFEGEVTWMTGMTAGQTLEQHLELGPQDDRIPEMPVDLVELLRQCFQSVPEDRPSDMGTIVTRLKAIYEAAIGEPYPRRTPEAEATSPDRLNNRAVSLIDLGKKDEALELWKQALDANPNHGETIYNQALFAWREGKITDVTLLRILRQLEQRATGSWETRFMIAQVHLERGNCAEALKILEHIGEGEDQSHEVQSALKYARRNLESGRRLLRTLGQHQGPVHTTCLSWDGALGLSAGGLEDGDGEAYIWNIETGEQVMALSGHRGPVRAVALSADGLHTLTGGTDGVVAMWNHTTGDVVHTFRGHTGAVTCVLPGEDGQTILSGSADGTVRAWDPSTGKALSTLNAHPGGVTAMCMGEYGRSVITSGMDGVIRIWDIRQGRCARELTSDFGAILDMASTNNRKFILGGTARGIIEYWDLSTGTKRVTMRAHSGPVTCVALSRKGYYAITGSTDAKLRLWEMESRRCLYTFEAEGPVSLDGAGKIALAAGDDNSVQLWAAGFDVAGLVAPMLICHADAGQI